MEENKGMQIENAIMYEQQKEQENQNYLKKKLKKELGHMGWTLFLYELAMNVGIIVFIVYVVVAVSIHCALRGYDVRSLDITNQISSGVGMYLVALLFATIPLYVYGSKYFKKEDIFDEQKRMTGKACLLIVLCMFGMQTIFQIAGIGIESIFNFFGYSTLKALNEAFDEQSVLVNFYVVLLGPIMEELLFRGVILKTFSKYGKIIAIMASSILFGIFHGNIVQGIYAFSVGIILAYVALEYSIKWSILLHMLNNAVASGLEPMLSGFPEIAQTLIVVAVFGLCFIAEVIIIICHRKQLKAYIGENRTNIPIYGTLFSRAGIILFLLINVVSILLFITPLES